MTHIQININSKIYPAVQKAGQHLAIADLKLTLHSNEFICLVGPSGCGKTTLLNIIADLDPDYEGEIIVGRQHAHPKIGYIFQNPRLLPWRTVRENIELVLESKQRADIIDPLLETMQLTQSQHVYPERLSVGMSRRVSIIRAFAVDPEVLLMDEPFVSLDAPTARQVRELLLKLWQQRPHTVLFVTHDLREAIALADRIVFLSAAPMHVISEITVPIPRNDRDNEAALESFRQQLLQNYPDIKKLL
ncbi:Aliphatic sulfonates import ATP-binding protein SsuB [Candidatus Methylobacter favarea]|uniref:Aliphatic sulfonates import ATP-binding protein SsuB n=1 Tax=Candidatus Methylobacter favarea TaxID=2707345 RepID=A0A8S0XRG0_9GAMM|nr:ATP-binding cassette domain-containing protein [Candidatus Methylobacter favarea]CAA9889969.1 Aliphatic sulfonates import ATP-binding protein SsuB [Candidatus Methylobacter favarea]